MTAATNKTLLTSCNLQGKRQARPSRCTEAPSHPYSPPPPPQYTDAPGSPGCSGHSLSSCGLAIPGSRTGRYSSVRHTPAVLTSPPPHGPSLPSPAGHPLPSGPSPRAPSRPPEPQDALSKKEAEKEMARGGAAAGRTLGMFLMQ